MAVLVIGEGEVVALKRTGCAAVWVAADAGVENPFGVDVGLKAFVVGDRSLYGREVCRNTVLGVG